MTESRFQVKSARLRRLSAAALALTFLLILGAGPSQAGTVTVTNTNDSGAGSLRQALSDAVGDDTIAFDASLNGQTINVTSGDLVVGKSLTIDGPGRDLLTIDAGDNSRVFYVAGGVTVTIRDLTIQNGSNPQGGGIYAGSANLTLINLNVGGCDCLGCNSGMSGAGIFSQGVLNVDNCVFENNNTMGSYCLGGAIFQYGATLTITNSTILDNLSSGSGSGIYVTGSIVNISATDLNRNGTDTINGGGLFSSESQITISDSTFRDNRGYFGGGIYFASSAAGPLTLTNCTFYDNKARGNGGGLYNEATAKISFCTFSGNVADSEQAGAGNADGGGIYNNSSGGAACTLKNSIVAGNQDLSISPAHPDCSGNFTTGIDVYNIIGDGTGSNFINGSDHNTVGSAASPVDAQLWNRLAYHGGATPLLAPLPLSPALAYAATSTDVDGAAVPDDQRGVTRSGPPYDIGSYAGCKGYPITGALSVVVAP